MSDDRDDVERLLRLAGPREAVAEERTERVRAAVHAEWLSRTRARTRRKRIAWGVVATAAAAAIVLIPRLSVWRGEPVAPAEIVATAETVTGNVQVTSARADGASTPVALRTGDAIRSGDRIDTTNGLAALGLGVGTSVRLDRGTVLRPLAGNVLALDAGAIYVDSGADGAAGGLEIRTASGVVRDVGTQFEVRLIAAAVRVRVRTGSVRMSRGRDSHDANPGDEVTLGLDGALARRRVLPYGPEWAWLQPLVPSFELEGRSLRDFLDWVARENGWRVTYLSRVAEESARTAIQHGSIRGLAAEDALAAVLSTNGLAHRLDAGSLEIGP